MVSLGHGASVMTSKTTYHGASRLLGFSELRVAVNDALRAASLTVLGTPTTTDLLVHKPTRYALLIGDGTRLNKCDLDGGEIAIFSRVADCPGAILVYPCESSRAKSTG